MNQEQGSGESGDAGGAGADAGDTAPGRDRPATRWLVWVALAAAIVVAAVCATDDPEVVVPVGQAAGVIRATATPPRPTSRSTHATPIATWWR